MNRFVLSRFFKKKKVGKIKNNFILGAAKPKADSTTT